MLDHFGQHRTRPYIFRLALPDQVNCAITRPHKSLCIDYEFFFLTDNEKRYETIVKFCHLVMKRKDPKKRLGIIEFHEKEHVLQSLDIRTDERIQILQEELS